MLCLFRASQYLVTRTSSRLMSFQALSLNCVRNMVDSTTMKSERRKTSVAIVQFTATMDKQKNLNTCLELIRKAKDRRAEMIFLPEGFDYVSETSADITSLSESLTGPVLSSYLQIAKELNVWLSLGGYHHKDDRDPRAHNSHIVVNNEGKIVEIYRKAHLFVVDIPGKVSMDETRYCIPGERIVPPVLTPAGKLGLMTALLRARAIENQCYVIASAQCGMHAPNRESFGHSMIVNPWGTILAQCQEGPGIALAEIDLDYLYNIRTNMPVQSHRRHDLYQLMEAPISLPDFSMERHNFGGHTISRNEVFYETRLSLALVNLKPVVVGHSLVIPKRSVEKFLNLTPAEIADMFHVVQKVEKMLEERFSVNSTTICCQDGFNAGQTVKHVHVHIIPRKPGDFGRDELYKELESHDKGENRKPRTPEEMGSEAKEFRKIMYGSSLKWTN